MGFLQREVGAFYLTGSGKFAGRADVYLCATPKFVPETTRPGAQNN